MTAFQMPSLGADMDDGTLLEWLVKPGDSVHRGDLMAVVDTAKAAVEVETFDDGVVDQLLIEPGQKVAVGTVLATLSAAEPTAAAPAEAPVGAVGPPEQTPIAPPAVLPWSLPPKPEAILASPLVRHLATELGIDLSVLHGSGRGGRITRSDVEHCSAPRAPAAACRRVRISPLARRLASENGLRLDEINPATPDAAITAEDVRRAISARAVTADRATPPAAAEQPATAGQREADHREADHRETMRQAIAGLMSRSNTEIPHYYVSATVDLSTTLEWLHEQNAALPVTGRMLPAAALLKAVAIAANRVGGLNGEWHAGRFEPSGRVNLGLVTSLRRGGLLVPVIADAASRSVADLMAEMRAAAERARTGRLRASELTGATITVSSLGDRGVDSVYGVIFPPQVAMVGIGTVLERPWAVDGMLAVRRVVTFTLAADHRASDGAVGARFLNLISRLLQTPEEL